MKHMEAYFGSVEAFEHSWHLRARLRCRIAVGLFAAARQLCRLADRIDRP